MCFVFEAFLMMEYTKSAITQLKEHDREPNHTVIDHLVGKGQVNTKSKILRFCYCRCPFNFCKTKTYDSAVHKLYRVFFKNFYRRKIKESLHGRSAQFDFASYLVSFWK